MISKNVIQKTSYTLILFIVFSFFVFRQVKRSEEGGLTKYDKDIKIINNVVDNFLWSTQKFDVDAFSIDATKELSQVAEREFTQVEAGFNGSQRVYVSDYNTTGPLYSVQALNIDTEFDLNTGFVGRLSELPKYEVLSQNRVKGEDGESLVYRIKFENPKNAYMLGKLFLSQDRKMMYGMEVVCAINECNFEDYYRFIESFRLLNN